MSMDDFLDSKYKECPKCGTNLFRDFDGNEKKFCNNCNHEIIPKKISQEKSQRSLFDF